MGKEKVNKVIFLLGEKRGEDIPGTNDTTMGNFLKL
jgi:hypothetical protein